jgi:hypothetical protein
MWKPRRLTILRASMACYRGNFTFRLSHSLYIPILCKCSCIEISFYRLPMSVSTETLSAADNLRSVINDWMIVKTELERTWEEEIPVELKPLTWNLPKLILRNYESLSQDRRCSCETRTRQLRIKDWSRHCLNPLVWQ